MYCTLLFEAKDGTSSFYQLGVCQQK